MMVLYGLFFSIHKRKTTMFSAVSLPTLQETYTTAMKNTPENTPEKLKTVIEAVGSIINSISGPLAVLGSDLVVLKANDAFYDIFDIKPEETEGTSIFDLVNKQLEASHLQELFNRVLTNKSKFHSLDIAYKTESSEPVTMRLSARVVQKTDIHSQLIVVSAEDMTHIERNKANDRIITRERALDLVAARDVAEKKAAHIRRCLCGNQDTQGPA
ncbi:PAS domain-containing protein [Desulfovibrio sp. DV]|uniref:PAS domain-containing protein n=1 Tax=Desulfovibrio sp. DV TaxID=1844708 RepID=UPI001C37D881|nr:PAS domain-containing protein [Desulfovibrio sp. DV]